MATDFRFLVTTDNHMGFRHDDQVRRKDSFMAFAETLQIAREKDVDFILLGGDLFHMNRPNAAIEHKCIKILRQHMNAKSSRDSPTFRRVSGEFSHFERVKHGNFEDPSLSVPHPIFTIHGNHDDPVGPAGKSVCEKLATCGLLNYFGKVNQVKNEKEIHVEPIVLEKGPIKIALYGIGFIPDKKLCNAFRLNYVTFKQPQPDTFNVLVVHQNRVKYDADKHIPDSLFPNWFHLIIRGHEHDAIMPEPIPESQVGGLVYQPGSTVATSIEVRESAVKQCGLMSVVLNDAGGDGTIRYKLKYDIINLRCYRKMIFKDIYQKDVFEHIKKCDGRKKLTPMEYRNIFKKFVIDEIDVLLEKSDQEKSQKSQESCGGSSDVNVTSLSQDSATPNDGVYRKLFRFNMPLLRVRLEFVNKTEVFDDLEVNQLFYPNQVANRDIIKFRKQKVVQQPDGTKLNLTFTDDAETGANDIEEDGIGEVEAIDLLEERKDTIDTMILNYFKDKPENQRLTAISLDEYTEAVRAANEEGNVIAKVLSKKRNAILHKYKNAIQDDKTAELHFSNESKIRDWFIASFTGQDPNTLEPNADWDDDDMDDGVIVLN